VDRTSFCSKIWKLNERSTFYKAEKRLVEIRTNLNLSAIHLLACNSKQQVLKYLMEIGMIPLQNCSSLAKLIFYYAAKDGLLANLQFLLQHDRRTINDVDNNGKTALKLAAWNNQAEVVFFLIKSGADIKIQDDDSAVGY